MGSKLGFIHIKPMQLGTIHIRPQSLNSILEIFDFALRIINSNFSKKRKVNRRTCPCLLYFLSSLIDDTHIFRFIFYTSQANEK